MIAVVQNLLTHMLVYALPVIFILAVVGLGAFYLMEKWRSILRLRKKIRTKEVLARARRWRKLRQARTKREKMELKRKEKQQ